MPMRSLVLLATAALLGLQVLAAPALAGQRVALVIGNASYAHAPSLANPLNDANDMGAALERLGFAVTQLPNASRAELWDSLQQFSLAASASETAVVFYAGHGIEVDKRNFLVPVDARLLSDADVEFEAVPLDLLSRAVERARGLRLIILDACRDNPFAVAMQRSGATRSIGRGLASVEPSGETLVAYAAKEGTVAADGKGRNSPYATALLAHLEEPGLEVGLMFRKVRDAVLASTGGRQEPFVYGSLSSEGAYLAALPEPEPAPTPALETVTVQGGEEPKTPDPDRVVERSIAAEKELLFWESVKDSQNPQELQAYLDRYPEGTYAVLARSRLKGLIGPEEKPDVQIAVTPDEPERVVSPEPAPPEPETVEASLGLERAERRQIQMGLAALGFDPGPADGLFGQRTRASIGGWQSSQDGDATGYLDAEAAKVLLAAGEGAASNGLLLEAKNVLSLALVAAQRVEGEDDRARALATIAEVQAEAGNTLDAVQLLSAAKAIGQKAEYEFALSYVARVQAATGDIAGALMLARKFKDDYIRDSAIEGIAIVQARTGDIRGAVTTAQRIGSIGLRDGAFFEIAKAQAAAGNIRDALATAHRIDSGIWSGRAFAQIAAKQLAAEDAKGAAQSVSAARTAAQMLDEAYWRAEVYAEIAAVQARAGDARGAARSFSDALTAAQSANSEDGRTHALFSIAYAQAEAGDIRRALATARTTGDYFGFRVKAFAHIAATQAKAGDAEGAADAFSEALTAVQSVDHMSSRAWALHSVVRAQAEAGFYQEALMTAERIQDYSTYVHALTSIARELVKAAAASSKLAQR